MRPFTNDIDEATWRRFQAESLRSRYRGREFQKNPLDQALYVQLIERLKPHTVIEIGVNDGGSVLWFADLMRAHGIDPTVVGVELTSKPELNDPAVRFLQGDALDLGATLTPELLADLPRPWLVVEDCAHYYDTSLAVIEFFAPRMQSGEYLVVEDGIVGSWTDEEYAKFDDGPNRAVRDFLARPESPFVIDTELCDFFGRNATYCPNGWLVRQ